MTTSAITAPSSCTTSKDASFSKCTHQIPSMLLCTVGIDSISSTKNAIKPFPLHFDQSLPGNSCLGGVSATVEPLKIDLYSDDSSIDSCADSDDDDDFFSSTSAQNDDADQTAVVVRTDPSYLQTASSSENSVPSLELSSDDSATSASSLNSCIKQPLNYLVSNNRKRKRESTLTSGRRKNKRSVSLHKSVSVIPIPSRQEYSCTVRRKLWSSSQELFENAARNSVEFASEGWNWRQVIEDEGMIIHNPTGELIHPIHLRNILQQIDREEAAKKGNIKTSSEVSQKIKAGNSKGPDNSVTTGK